ncbi:MAG TPA: hypothetical protein VKB79_19685 [Bryobacteraceae bacterium]|nr:hypothetical protein [Bryobacteraceae bacterium]
MKKLVIALALSTLALAARREYKLEDREAFHHTFSNDASLDVDAVSGSITVVGDSGNTIRVDGEKVIHAADQEEIQRAKREVVLDVNEKGGVAQLYVNGPFRDNDHASENHGFHDHRDREYDVAYNFTIHVPRTTELLLHTVNGEIKTQDTAGRFNLKGINGSITMTDIAGSGTADTLNGNTTITFRESPRVDSYFKSFNGKVDVTFPPNLSANLSLKTFNGSAWTDFETTALASTSEPGTERNGRHVYKTNKYTNLKVASGGPELKFETFNGNIQIHKSSR